MKSKVKEKEEKEYEKRAKALEREEKRRLKLEREQKRPKGEWKQEKADVERKYKGERMNHWMIWCRT